MEGSPFGFDAAGVVGLAAQQIENRLLQLQSPDLLLVCFHTSVQWLGTAMQAMVGVSADGAVAWRNTAAAGLLGPQSIAAPHPPVAELLGQELPTLMRLCVRRLPKLCLLPNGLNVWLRTRLQAHDGLAAGRLSVVASRASALCPSPGGRTPALPPASEDCATAATMAPTPNPRRPTLQHVRAQLFSDALAAHAGNVSKAARALGVSRGALYRHLQRTAKPLAGKPKAMAPASSRLNASA